VALAKSAGESSVFKRVIEVIVNVVLSCIMPNPFVTAGMDVRGFGVALLIAVSAGLFLLGSHS
jgi:hypothetical protein